MKRLLILLCLLGGLWCSLTTAKTVESTFYTLNTKDGLSDNHILQLMHLSDGRLLIATASAIDIYDGLHFTTIPASDSQWQRLPLYGGATHLYVDTLDRLWQKDHGHICCKDLRTLSSIQNPLNLFRDVANGEDILDFFIDGQHTPWLVLPRHVVNTQTGVSLPWRADYGVLQDIDQQQGQVFCFTSRGHLLIFDTRNGRKLHDIAAYDSSLQSQWDYTSLVVRKDRNHYLQIRTGRKGSVLLYFDIARRQCRRLYDCPYLLHSLVITPRQQAYVTSEGGYLIFDLEHPDQHPQSLTQLRLPDGTFFSTGNNCVCQDRWGGIWLGTYSHGLLYSSPLSGIFVTRPLHQAITPILTSIYLHGRPLEVGSKIMPLAPPYMEQLELGHNDNALAFQFTTMNYVQPRATTYRYRLNDGPWHEVNANSATHEVDDHGTLYLSLLNLSPDDYTLQVQATTQAGHYDGNMRTLHFRILPPWWATPWACAGYVIALFLFIVIVTRLYTQQMRRRLIREKHEELLMQRVQDLVQQVSQLQNGMNVVLSEEVAEDNNESSSQEEPQMTAEDMEFLQRATALVQQHLSDANYHVEQLASDLCMERSGLYRRLTTLMDRSPVAFIRSQRLQHAAELLKKGRMTINEIAEQTGFSSSSYLSKCFQKEFGCKPSEYAQEHHP